MARRGHEAGRRGRLCGTARASSEREREDRPRLSIACGPRSAPRRTFGKAPEAAAKDLQLANIVQIVGAMKDTLRPPRPGSRTRIYSWVGRLALARRVATSVSRVDPDRGDGATRRNVSLASHSRRSAESMPLEVRLEGPATHSRLALCQVSRKKERRCALAPTNVARPQTDARLKTRSSCCVFVGLLRHHNNICLLRCDDWNWKKVVWLHHH